MLVRLLLSLAGSWRGAYVLAGGWGYINQGRGKPQLDTRQKVVLNWTDIVYTLLRVHRCVKESMTLV